MSEQPSIILKRSDRAFEAHPRRPSTLLLRLVQRARWLWLGWLESQCAAVNRWRDERRIRIAAEKAATAARDLTHDARAVFETLEPKLLLSADLMPMHVPDFRPQQLERLAEFPRHVNHHTPATQAHAHAQTQADGQVPGRVKLTPSWMLRALADSAAPTLSITGPGAGQFSLQRDGYALQLTGTDATTTVAFSLPSGGQLALTGITASSAVGAINFSNADLTGNANFAASVTSLSLGKVSQSVITVTSGADFAFKANAVVDSRIAAKAGNIAITVTDWNSSTVGASRIEAAGIKTLTTTGNLNADVFLNGVASGYTLGTVQIGGSIAGGLWSVHGRASSITAGSTASAWSMNINNTLVQLITKGDASGNLAVLGLQVLQIGGAARGLHVLVGTDLGDDAALGGTGANSDSFKVGTLARLRVLGDFADSSVYVSIDPVDGVLADGNDRQIGTSVQRVQELVIGGQITGRSSIAAPGYPTSVIIGGQSVNPASVRQLSSIPLDVIAPAIISFSLAAASDTGTLGDNHTTASVVALVGVAEAGASLSLRKSGNLVASATAEADGSFSFTGVSLDLGDNAYALTAADAAGNTSGLNLTVVRDASGSDTTAPTLSASLQADTGKSGADGITSNPAIAGIVTDDVGVTQLLVALDPGSDAGTTTFTNLIASVQAGGAFTLTRSQLNSLAGGTLTDGRHTLRLIAKDAAGNASSNVDVVFTLDSLPPTGASFGISTTDALNGDDSQTSAAIATLRGTAEAGSTITLVTQGLTTTASGTGSFQLPGVAFVTGSNLITLTVSDAAGNSQAITRTLTRVAQTQSDSVLDWITTALTAIQLDVSNPTVATRTLAIQSVAVYDTLAAIQGTPAYMVQRSVSGAVSADAAAAQAAYRVLYTLFPGQRDSLNAALATSLAKVTDGDAKTAGIALGDSIAQAVLDIRASDGYLDFVTDDGGTAVGQWRSVGPMFLVAQDPQWGDVTPFALSSGDEFRAAPPPALDSPEYAAAINEVQSLGSATSTTRTADQSQQAQFWADGLGSYTPPGHWDQIAAQVAASKGNSLSANARLMAQLNVALADAAIASWDTKYTYDFWRPVTAIQNADQDGNSATTQDANWTSLLIAPPHPSYVSGHSTFSAAAAGILAATFGDNTSFSTTSATLLNVVRNFTSFSQAADEAGESRIYGGIHTSLDNEAGKTMGAQVAQAVLAKFALTDDTQAPSVVIAGTPAATHANLAVTGQLLDNLSGVVSAQYRIDDGDLQTLSFDADGKFSLSTAFALDGTQDGLHSITLVATDTAGNVSPGATRSFTLDTKAPALSLASIAAGDTLTTATRLTGAADPNGSQLAQLSYQFDGGKTHTLIFDGSTGSFDQALTLGDLGVGDHTLNLTATDAAGNTTTLSRAVTLASLAPFTISKVTPSDGSGDVGVTYRPQVYFSRAVNPATLTADSFYATGPDGNKLATTIVPALDGSFAWLFFTNPMPGGSNVTLHLDGSAIRAAADGSFLDADGDGASGGAFAWSFTTVSTSSVLGAKLSGKVVDPGADLQPMTFDDIRRGNDGIIHTPDDIFLNPIIGAKVSIIGRPDLVTYTDANGNFSFDSVPVGDVKVAIDGRTATNPPAGIFWPEMVMDVLLKPGITNTMMGSMGSTESQQENANRQEVYLPRVQTSALQVVSNSAPTTITVDEKSAPDLTDEQRGQLTLTVTPGAAVGFDGKVLSNVKIGINTVPPELVKDMLPVGVMQHTFDITIQAPGVDTFAQPVQITFPNVFNAAPGTKLNVLSFDHTTGRLVVNGTATVSASGKSVVSDEGSGIVSPGWHGVTPPGVCVAPVTPPPTSVPPQTTLLQQPEVHGVLMGETPSGLQLSFQAPTGVSSAPVDPNCQEGAVNPQSTLRRTEIEIQVDPILQKFMRSTTTSSVQLATGTSSYKITLRPGDTAKSFDLIALNYAELLDALTGSNNNGASIRQWLPYDLLYGAKISVTVSEYDNTGHLASAVTTPHYVYRLVDATDSKDDGSIGFEDALVDGVKREKTVFVYSVDMPTLHVNGAFTASANGQTVTLEFDPTGEGDTTGALSVNSPEDQPGQTKIQLAGTGEIPQYYYVDADDIATSLANTYSTGSQGSNTWLDSVEASLIDTPAERTAIGNAVVNYIDGALGGYQVAKGAKIGPNPANMITLDFSERGAADILGTSSRADASAEFAAIDAAIKAGSGLNSLAAEFILSDAVNSKLAAGIVDVFTDAFLRWGSGTDFPAPPAPTPGQPAQVPWEFVYYLGNTALHELGHAFGLTHTYSNYPQKNASGQFIYTDHGVGPRYAVSGGADDIMATTSTSTIARSYIAGSTDDALRIAFDEAWSATQAKNALTYYTTYFQAGVNATPVGGDPDGNWSSSISGSRIAIFDLDSNQVVSGSFQFGDVSADAAVSSRHLSLVNFGSESVTINDLSLNGDSRLRLNDGNLDSFTLAAGESKEIQINLTAADVGDFNGTLSYQSGDTSSLLTISGRLLSPTANATITNISNNAGWVTIGSSKSFGAITLTNYGLQPLSLSSAEVVSGQADFEFNGFDAAGVNSVTLNKGQSTTVLVSFSPSAQGLSRSTLSIVTSDPTNSLLTFGVAGTGGRITTSAQWGEDYVSIERSDAQGAVLRMVSKANGWFSAFLAPGSRYNISIFDPVSGYLAAGTALTSAAGTGADITRGLVFGASTAPDTDFDGLPDDVEFAIGTNQASKDSDKDGLDDFSEIQQGLDPLGGLGVPTGVIASASPFGSSEAVAVVASTDGSGGLLALVATGSQGLAVVDATKFTEPRLLAQLVLPGTNIDVAADSARGIAVVAGGDAGLHIVDIRNSSGPELLRTIPFDFPVTHVEVRDGTAYLSTGTALVSVDLNTGDIRQTLDLGNLGGSSITDIAIDGSMIYTMDSNHILRSTSIVEDVMNTRGSLSLSSGGGKLFVGGGVAYVGTLSDSSQGFLTVNVTDPTNLTVLSNVDAANVAGQSLAANGSGLLVTAGSLRGPQGQQIYALDVSSVADPTNTGNFITRYNLPAAPKDVVIANGIAFVADGTGGLQIVNYASFDSKGIAPSVSVSLDAVDADPDTAGIQVLEGRSITVKPVVADDVQVRNVELLVNGQVVANDASFPFDFTTQAPAIAQGGNTLTIQVRATDTGGNATLSDPIVLTVVPDTFPPVLQSVSVDEGASRFFVKSLDLQFDEPLDVSKLATSGVSLVRAGVDGLFGTSDDVASPVTLDTRSQGQIVSILPGDYLAPGDYQLTVSPSIIADIAGNALAAPIVRHFTIRPASDVQASSGVPANSQAPSANPGQQIGIAVPFDPATAKAQIGVIDSTGTKSSVVVPVVRWDTTKGIAYFKVPYNAVSGDGVVYSLVGNVRTDFPDGTFPLQIVPLVTGVEVQSVSADGQTATLYLYGRGFVEGNNSEYRFGSGSSGVVIVDGGASAGPDVQQVYDYSINQYVNGAVYLTVPLSNGAFGPITIATAGGVSASYSVSLSGVQAMALSGTPADATKASANPGQAITLVGSGLSTATDVLLSYTNIDGSLAMVQLSPIAASADGSQATLVVPAYANGVFSLQVFGSATSPVLQIVPVLKSFDDNGTLVGAGFVEGATTYAFPGSSVADTDIAAGPDVVYYYDSSLGQYIYNGQANLASSLLHYGAGQVSVSTAGGTAAPIAINTVRPGSDTAAVGALADVAVTSTGALWTVDTTNPGHLLRLDPANGLVLQTITLDASFGNQYTANYAGLQVLPQAMSLAGVAVPAGSLLLFAGYPYNTTGSVAAINPATGAVIAELTLTVAYYSTAGVFDATSGHLFLLSHQYNQLVELDPADGAEIGRHDLPINIQSWAGLAIDPTDGNFWIGSYSGGSQLVEVDRSGAELRRIDLASQGVNTNEISGLAFAADGTLRVASTSGVIYRVSLGTTPTDAATQPATLTQVNGSALSGTAAQAGVAAANVGQVIELIGSHFGAGTQVLFNIRDNTGKLAVVAVKPLLIDATGTRLQVIVPDLATTGDIKVSNIGTANLGFNSYTDAVHRGQSFSFTAGSSTATVRFSDGGLEALDNESWGIDNVLVKLGGTTVFQDDFEAGAKAAWSNQTTNGDATAAFSRFSGRFNNTSQSLNLSGLTAGQTYTLSFDLYALDSWDGNSGNPDQISVAVDDVTVYSKTISNYAITSAQTIDDSTGIRLQIVPTLASITANPGGDNVFGLNGSGFMEGAFTVTIGGVALTDTNSGTTPFDVSGARNDTLSIVAPRTLDGPVRITTEGGWAEVAGFAFNAQPLVQFSGITASANAGVPGNASQPSAATGQTIVLTGQGFTSATLVQFLGLDDTGKLGTLTRTGTAGNNGTTLSVEVPALARTGLVTVLGSNASFTLQVVPTLRAIGGTVAAGNTIVLEGTGLTANDLQIQIDGQGVGSFTVRTINDGPGSSYADQQFITLTVPAGVSAGVITASTAGGTSTLRSGAVAITALADQTPAADVGDTIATALNPALGLNQSVKVNGSIATGTDVDLHRVDLNAGDQLTLTLTNSGSLYSYLRIFDATGKQLQANGYFNPGTTNTVRWTAPSTGSFYVGISPYSNTTYDPNVAGSGTNGSYTGSYTLGLARLSAGSSHLAGITATATSGTPANAGVASANTGQTLTLTGLGLLSTDRVVFTTIDDSGNLSEVTVTPTTFAADGTSLTVVVPNTATTGRLRLERDSAGIVLQVVPTLTDVTANSGSIFSGGGLTLSGSGFAEGASAVLFGSARVGDVGRYYGLDAYSGGTRIGLTVPEGLATGPIRVSTVGGTSAVFGLSLSSIASTANSGTAGNTNQPAANIGQAITLNGAGFDLSLDIVFQTVDSNGTRSEVIVRPTVVSADGTQAQVLVPQNAITGTVRVVGDANGAALPLQIIAQITGLEVQSVSGDGQTATLLLYGRGFVEGNNSEYRFGSGTGGVVIVDAGANAGPDVQQVYDYSINQYVNGAVYLTVPLSNGAFGPITIATAGGVSASYSVSLSSVQAVALSGTPADATKASANPGQAITLVGTGLSTATDVLLSYTDYNGNPAMVQLSPIAASADGTQATLVVPTYANGVFSLQVFGSAASPVLQIVPVVKGFDDNGTFVGAGFVEGATTYAFPGNSVADTASDSGPDVVYYYDYTTGQYIYNGQTNLASSLLHYGAGQVSVTTAGGTAAPIAINTVRPGSDTATVGALADVAIDKSSGALWTVDVANPGHLLRLDPATGRVLQTIELDASFGNQYTANYAGLQVLPQAMSLAGVAVPAGSLLLFAGYPYNTTGSVAAINPATGAVIAELTLTVAYYSTAGVFDATSGHLFLLSHQYNQLVELDPADGAEIGRHDLPINIQSWAGLAIDPTDGNFWIGSYSGGSQLVEVDRSGAELRRIDLASQGVNTNEISGLAFAADGTLRVASTSGVIYRVSLGTTPTDAATQPATLTQVNGSALSGTAAQAGVAAANVGQVIELIGSHFGAGTQVLFNIRDNTGKLAVVAVKPLLIDATGTRLQVIVPDLATTGDIKVSNIGTANLGFNSYTDAVHRGQSFSFTAGSSTATVRFSDGGLEALDNESWGIDNVLVKLGGTTVFQDDFEAGAKAAWSNQTTNGDATAAFSRFSGRFNNTSQSLNLSGLTAGQTYTLSFDLYALDSWDGNSGNPDQISVAVDDVTVYSKTISNYAITSAQTIDDSTGIRLQIVPTLASITANPGGDNVFGLNGSGFMEGAFTVTIGGVALTDTNSGTTPFDVSGARNDTLSIVAPRTLDGPVRITTEGGWAEVAGFAFNAQPLVQFSGITASANAGVPGNASQPSAATGQTIVLTGQGFTSATLVQFLGLDDTGKLGTLTRTGTAGNNGTTLSVEVPALARTGLVTVLGSNASFTLQVVPTLRAIGGTVAAGNTIVLEGTGLTANDLQIQIDGQGVGSFTVRTINDGPGSSYADQQFITLTVPAGVSAGVITASTAGGTSTLRSGAVAITALADQTPAADVGDTIATALNPALGLNQSVKVNGSIATGTDVDLHRVDLNAGDQLTLTLTNSGSLYSYLRIFDATGKQLQANGYFNPGTTNTVRWTAPSTGSFYVGISPYSNTTYDPNVAGSGTNGSYTGSYTLGLARLSAGSSHLAGITATATSGTPANAGVASANTGQTLTLTGLGLLSTDRVVFTTIDDSGNLSEVTVTPTTFAADGTSLTVVVPNTATTGRLRLERDSAGIVLQVVPRITAFTANGGTAFTLNGSGFAEGSTSIILGPLLLDDEGRYYGIDVYGSGTVLTDTPPLSVSRSTVQVQTVGGTSAVFATGQP